jgi:hydrogenase small subunit
MSISRRSFLGYCIASAAALKLSSLDLLKLQAALANPNAPNVIWLHGSGCSGCSVSFLNRITANASDTLPASAASVLTDSISLVYHPTLMAAAGQTASDAALQAANNGPYILIVEGGIPTAFDGACCWAWSRNGEDITIQKVVTALAPGASSIVAVGTCAAFGGVSASGVNPGTVVPLSTAINQPTLNISGCPPHPDWIVWAIAQLLANGGTLPSNLPLDRHNRPLGTWPDGIYGAEVHAKCPRHDNPHAATFGIDNQCLIKLGCYGPGTMAPCPTMLWNDGSNWCIDANANCISCTEPTFPDAGDLYNI